LRHPPSSGDLGSFGRERSEAMIISVTPPQRPAGRSTNGTGVGRAQPLLTDERAHHEDRLEKTNSEGGYGPRNSV